MRVPRTGSLIVLGLAIVAVAVIISMIGPWGSSKPIAPVDSPVSTEMPLSQTGVEVGIDMSDDGTWVHVVGAVREPGLYLVASGSRVVDAVMAAGGLLETADQCGINLARPLSDGEQLIVPNRPEGESTTACHVATSSGAGAGASGPVSLSRADVTTLDSLPGIGPTLAQRIIEWRTAHGGFTSVDQLAEVSGIGNKLFTQLQPLVTP